MLTEISDSSLRFSNELVKIVHVIVVTLQRNELLLTFRRFLHARLINSYLGLKIGNLIFEND
jgi:hypothetical protein